MMPRNTRRLGRLSAAAMVASAAVAAVVVIATPGRAPITEEDVALVELRLSRGNDDPAEPVRETAEIIVSIVAEGGDDDAVSVRWTARNTSGSEMFAGRGTQYVLRLRRPGDRDLVRLMTLDEQRGAERLAASIPLPSTPTGAEMRHHLTVELGQSALSENRFVQQEIDVDDHRSDDGTRRFNVAVRQNNLGIAFGRLDTPLRIFDHVVHGDRWLGAVPALVERYPDGSVYQRRGPASADPGAISIESALASGDFARLRELLVTDASPDRIGIRQPMVRAVLDADHAGLATMLDEGCDPDGLGPVRFESPEDRIRAKMLRGESISPLQLAARLGDAIACRMLLAHGATIDDGSHYGGTALGLAIEHRQREVIELLLEAGAEPRLGLHIAIAAADERLALDLARTAPEAVDSPVEQTGETALMLAVRDGQVSIAAVLIGAFGATNAFDRFGHDVLWHARHGGCEAAIRLVAAAFDEVPGPAAPPIAHR